MPMFHIKGAEVGDLQQRLRDFTAELWRYRFLFEDVSSGVQRSIPTVNSQTDHQLVPGIMVFYIKKTMMVFL